MEDEPGRALAPTANRLAPLGVCFDYTAFRVGAWNPGILPVR